MQRQEGYYWVKISSWQIAEYDGIDWYLPGNEQQLHGTEFTEIGHRIPSNEELNSIAANIRNLIDGVLNTECYEKVSNQLYLCEQDYKLLSKYSNPKP